MTATLYGLTIGPGGMPLVHVVRYGFPRAEELKPWAERIIRTELQDQHDWIGFLIVTPNSSFCIPVKPL